MNASEQEALPITVKHLTEEALVDLAKTDVPV